MHAFVIVDILGLWMSSPQEFGGNRKDSEMDTFHLSTGDSLKWRSAAKVQRLGGSFQTFYWALWITKTAPSLFLWKLNKLCHQFQHKINQEKVSLCLTIN